MNTCPWCGQYSKYGDICSRRCSIEFQNQDPSGYKNYNSGSGCLGFIGLIFVVIMFIGVLSPNEKEKNSPKKTSPVIASEHAEPQSALTEEQSVAVSDKPSQEPTQKQEDNYQVLNDQDGYLVLRAMDGRSIRMDIMELNKTSVVLRRGDGVCFEISLNRLDADSIQRVKAFWSASKNDALDKKPKLYSVTGIGSGETLNVRNGAGSNYDIVARLPNGAGRLRIIGESIMNGSTEWVQIAFGDRTGWVSKSYLTAD